MPKNNKPEQSPYSVRMREKEALRRRHRKVVLFNDREMALINSYCDKHNIKAKSALIRRIVIEKLLMEAGENPPTLF